MKTFVINILNFMFATSNYQDLDWNRFEQLESKKTIREENRHV
jgi:hypothetical protein